MTDLVTGIIQAEEGTLTDKALIEFVKEHQDSLVQLQGRWGRYVAYLKEVQEI